MAHVLVPDAQRAGETLRKTNFDGHLKTWSEIEHRSGHIVASIDKGERSSVRLGAL